MALLPGLCKFELYKGGTLLVNLMYLNAVSPTESIAIDANERPGLSELHLQAATFIVQGSVRDVIEMIKERERRYADDALRSQNEYLERVKKVQAATLKEATKDEYPPPDE